MRANNLTYQGGRNKPSSPVELKKHFYCTENTKVENSDLANIFRRFVNLRRFLIRSVVLFSVGAFLQMQLVIFFGSSSHSGSEVDSKYWFSAAAAVAQSVERPELKSLLKKVQLCSDVSSIPGSGIRW